MQFQVRPLMRDISGTKNLLPQQNSGHSYRGESVTYAAKRFYAFASITTIYCWIREKAAVKLHHPLSRFLVRVDQFPTLLL